MPLQLVFSWFADAGAWPEHPGAGAAAVDAAVVGPMRLLDHIETMLGLGAPASRRRQAHRDLSAQAGKRRRRAVLGGFVQEGFLVHRARATELARRTGRGRLEREIVRGVQTSR